MSGLLAGNSLEEAVSSRWLTAPTSPLYSHKHLNRGGRADSTDRHTQTRTETDDTQGLPVRHDLRVTHELSLSQGEGTL